MNEESSNKKVAADAAHAVSACDTCAGSQAQKACLNDAIVYGDLKSPEAQEVLNSELIVGFSTRAPKVAGHKWIQLKGTFAQSLDVLTKHPVQKDKEGSAFFFNETALTGRFFTKDGVKYPFTHRAKAHAKSVTACAIDIDGTDKIDRVRDKLLEFGFFGILYTTHSHARKCSDTGDHFRVILPLECPFYVAAHGGDVKRAAERWVSFYSELSNKLGIEELDNSASKFVQMMYLPRRCKKNAPFKHYVVSGRALKFADMHGDSEVHSHQSLLRQKRSSERRSVQSIQKRLSNIASPCVARRHMLSDGFNVHRFHSDYGHRFDVPAFLKALNWDIRSENSGSGISIKCPNHLEHSEPDDGSDTACWSSPPSEGKTALIMCHHNHCRNLRTWNFFPLIEDRIADGEATLPPKFKSLSEMICSAEFYYD